MNEELMELLSYETLRKKVYRRVTEHLGPMIIARNTSTMSLGQDKNGNEIVVISPSLKMNSLRQSRSR